MTLKDFTENNPDAAHLVPKFQIGKRYRILSPGYMYDGKVGKLEYCKEGQAWLAMSPGVLAKVSLDSLRPVESANDS